MHKLSIMHIALGGCLRGEPRYGITEDTGGHITYILGAARALAKRHDVGQCEIVTRLFNAPELGEIHAREREIVGPGLVITRVDSGDRRYLGKEELRADRVRFRDALLHELRGRSVLPDIIHAHFADAADVAQAIRTELGIPFIYTPHSLGYDKVACCAVESGVMGSRLDEETRAIGAADAIIASSRDECERQLMAYSSARPERIRQVRPGIDQRPANAGDIAAARAVLEPFLHDHSRPIVLAIARPVRKKNLVSLVHAFGRNQKLRSSANLVILAGLRQSIASGEPEQVAVMRELVDAIDEYDLYGNVAYPKTHDQRTVRGLFALAAANGGVFANPAAFEPFGLTILEAAVHGCPVIATNRGGPVDIVAEIGHGELIEPTDPDSIARALLELLTDDERRAECVRNALERIGRVSWENYAAQFINIASRIVRPSSLTSIHRDPDLREAREPSALERRSNAAI